jgi:Ala-tRNA(Pro) deacylase
LAEEFENVDALDIKNLFLRDAKGKTHYLVVAIYGKEVNLKQLAQVIGTNRLSFASDRRLEEHLSVTTGAVSIFNLINNTDHKVIVYLDEEILKGGNVGFHPNINTETLILKQEGFKKFLETIENPIYHIRF